jgi:hypothetical protein
MRHTLVQALCTTAAKQLAAADAHARGDPAGVAGIILAIQADRARVLEGSFYPARGTLHPIAAIATASLFSTHLLVTAFSPMDSLTLYAAITRAAAPPAPLHRTELAYFLAVGTHQPTPDPILLGPLLPPSIVVLGRHSILGMNPK